MNAQNDRYFSIDVETDGPIPGRHSMVSFGITVAGVGNGVDYVAFDQDEAPSFYITIKPIPGNETIDDALRVSAPAGLTVDQWRTQLTEFGAEPAEAMNAAYAFIRDNTPKDERAVMVAWPITFDFPWMYHYFETYGDEGSPFGYSSALDIKGLFAAVMQQPIRHAIKKNLPPHLRSKRLHTHHPLDDAREQAEVFSNLKLYRPEN